MDVKANKKARCDYVFILPAKTLEGFDSNN